MFEGCRRQLVVLALIGPTLVVPVPKWHHHAEAGGAQHADCGLCGLALSVDCALLTAPPLELPPTVAPAAERRVPVPPSAPEVEHPARGPPPATR